MTSILHLMPSPRMDASVSIRLGKAIVEHLQLKYPDSTVTEINLLDQQVPHLDASPLQAFFTPTEELNSVNMQSIQYSDDAISQIMNADLIVIGSPMYNFTIHSSLKAWIDQITRAGKTFRYTESGPEGLVVGKKVYLAVASGGVYSNGPFQPYDSVVPYLKNILSFLGMTDLTVYRAEGLNIPELKDGAWEQALTSIDV